MILNPVRTWTKAGREKVLEAMGQLTGPGPLAAARAFLVTAVTLNSAKDDVNDFTAGTQGLEVSVPVEGWSAPIKSESLKTYSYCGPMNYAVGPVTIPMAIVGLVIVKTGALTVALAYLQFDSPIHIDQEGENVVLSVEVGFDGPNQYLMARVLPLGQ